jgi:large subunit ribosomal protein L3
MLGTKAGMTTWHMPNGEAVPCTVITFEDWNIITQIKNEEVDGYCAIQLGYLPAKTKRTSKSELGHFKKAGAPALKHVVEYRVENPEAMKLGQKIAASAMFKEGDLVDVSGTSIGKGFQGGIKRWNMHRGLMTHGSKSHRAPGSIGMRYSGDGGRVMPGLKMPGHLGNRRVTIRKLKIIKIDNLVDAIVIKGSVPGKQGSILSLTQSKIVGKTS